MSQTQTVDGEIVRHEPSQLAPADIRLRVNDVQRVLRDCMKDGTHYGKVPGCGDKPALLKPGAEMLCMMFRLSPRFTIRQTELPGGHREYEIRTELVHIPTGQFVGEGVGTCSTMEKKFRYRNAGGVVCPECAASAVKRSKFPPRGAPNGTPPGFYCYDKAGGCGAQFAADDDRIKNQREDAKAENPDIADVYNTVLKMGKKRSLVDAILTATAASDIFTQDIDEDGAVAPPARQPIRPTKRTEHAAGDTETCRAGTEAAPPQLDPPPAGGPPSQTNASLTSPPAGDLISEPQRRRLKAIVAKSGMDVEDIRAWMKRKHGFASSTEVTRDKYDEICAKIESGNLGDEPPEPGSNG